MIEATVTLDELLDDPGPVNMAEAVALLRATLGVAMQMLVATRLGYAEELDKVQKLCVRVNLLTHEFDARYTTPPVEEKPTDRCACGHHRGIHKSKGCIGCVEAFPGAGGWVCPCRAFTTPSGEGS